MITYFMKYCNEIKTGDLFVTASHVPVQYFLCIFMSLFGCHSWIYEGLTKLLVIHLGLFLSLSLCLAFAFAVRSKQY
jgi:hypothetical protein